MSDNELKQLETGARKKSLQEAIRQDKLMIQMAVGVILAALVMFVYIAFSSGRIDVIYWDNKKIDAPRALDLQSRVDTEIKSERWIRGFVRQFRRFYFVQPYDNNEFATSSLRWLSAHSSDEGARRSKVYLRDLEEYHITRRSAFSSFWSLNDPDALKIRPSDQKNGHYYAELLGTYGTKNSSGESLYDAKLRLLIKKVRIDGVENDLGGLNVTGLLVENAHVEYIEDYTTKEVVKTNLFRVGVK